MLRHLYLTNRFFYLFTAVAAVFVLAFFLPFLFPVAQTLLFVAAAVMLVDGFLLFRSGLPVEAERKLPRVLSLGDSTRVILTLHNRGALPLQAGVVDELPVQLQIRNFYRALALPPEQSQQLTYEIRPTERGAFLFGNVNLFLSTQLGLLERRLIIPREAELPVYPSLIQMKRLELETFDNIAFGHGLKRVRRIGHSYEFEQIKNYVRGDDYRSINWKASSRRASLMVNQYEDERSQQIYCVIDKSRAMKMPFSGLSLVDHAINTALVTSNIVLKKHDNAGLLTFSDKLGAFLPADRRANQLHKIMQALYREEDRKVEANYELLYYAARKLIKRRSLLLLFTNIESAYAMERALPILRRISKHHLLLVVFFRNTEIEDFSHQRAPSLEHIYHQTVAQQFVLDKETMVQQLHQLGIQTILTRPDELSVNTVNKYLELKARGLT